jgi:Bacterial membrane protein YfhO
VRSVARELAARPVLSAALVYATLALIFVGPGLLPGRVLSSSDSYWFQVPWVYDIPAGLERPANPEIDDAPSVLHTFVRHAKSELPHVPLWNPHIMAGRPFLADMQSQVLSPFSVPAYAMPFYESLAITTALKLFLACFGAFLLGRALGMRFAGSLMAGTVFGFNLWLVTWLVYPHASVWALIPWLMWLADRLLRRPDGLAFALLGGAVGIQFLAGHPESSFHALLVTVAFFALRAYGLRRAGGLPSVRRPLLVFAGSLVAGGLLAAVALLPFLELLLRSADIEQRAGSAAEAKMSPRFLLGFFLYDYWGRSTGSPLELFLLARAYYVGALPLMLGAGALILRPRLERLAVAGFGALCMAVVVGVPPIFQIVTALPLFSSGHNTRLALLALLCAALLAGWGLDELVERRDPWPRRKRWVLAAGALILVAPLVWVALAGTVWLADLGDAIETGWLLGTPPGNINTAAQDTIRLASVFVWVLFGGAALLLLALRERGRLPATAFATLALLLTVADLFRAGMGYTPAIGEKFAEQPATGAVRYLQSRRPSRYVAVGPIPQNALSMRFGLYEARGYDLPVDKRFDRYWRRYVNPQFASQVDENPLAIPLSLPEVDAERLRVLGLLGVTDILQSLDDPELDGLPGVRRAYDGPDARVYAYDRALPRAFVVGAQTVVPDADAALEAIVSPDFDARRTAVVEGEPIPRLPEGSAPPAGRARLGDLDEEQVEVSVRASRAGLLVLSDLSYPGWKAELNGEDAEIERVNYLMRGVKVPAGRSAVTFSYRPLSFTLGWVVSLLALVGLALTGAASLRRRRRGAQPLAGAAAGGDVRSDPAR